MIKHKKWSEMTSLLSINSHNVLWSQDTYGEIVADLFDNRARSMASRLQI